MKNILIAETDRIGDVILSLPVFKSIKKFDKRIRITALVNSYTEHLFNNFPYVDDIISFVTLKSKNDFQNLYTIIKNRDFDTALLLHPDYTIAKIVKKAEIQERYSYGWKWYQFLFSKVLIQHRSRNKKHQLEYNLELLNLLSVPVNLAGASVKLNPVRKEVLFIEKMLRKRRLTNKLLIGIHPGSGDSSINLPKNKYIELIQLLQKKYKNAKIVLTGSQKDKDVIDHILTHVKTSLYPMPLNLTLPDLIALISKMDFFISNSTGPMHIASALRIPVVSFFSPVFIHSPVRWGPYWGKRLVIQPDVQCKYRWKCKNRKCADYNCFGTVQFDAVLNFINSIKFS